MSDDEGGEGYDDYPVDADEPSAGLEPAAEEAKDEEGPQPGEDDFEELSDSSSGDEAPGDEGVDFKAQPTEGKADPISAASNRACTVHAIPPEEWISDDRLHTTEAAQALALRAEQIAKTGRAFVEHTLTDPVSIAYLEFYARRSPLILVREMYSDGSSVYVEKHPIRDMILPEIPPPPGVRGATASAAAAATGAARP